MLNRHFISDILNRSFQITRIHRAVLISHPRGVGTFNIAKHLCLFKNCFFHDQVVNNQVKHGSMESGFPVLEIFAHYIQSFPGNNIFVHLPKLDDTWVLRKSRVTKRKEQRKSVRNCIVFIIRQTIG